MPSQLLECDVNHSGRERREKLGTQGGEGVKDRWSRALMVVFAFSALYPTTRCADNANYENLLQMKITQRISFSLQSIQQQTP